DVTLAFGERAAGMIVIEVGRMPIQGSIPRHVDLVHMNVLQRSPIALRVHMHMPMYMHMQPAELEDEQRETSEDQQEGPEPAHGPEYSEASPPRRPARGDAAPIAASRASVPARHRLQARPESRGRDWQAFEERVDR